MILPVGSSVRRYIQLPAADRLGFRRALYLTAFCSFGLRCVPYKSLRGALDWVSPKLLPSGLASERLCWAVLAAARVIPGCSCLVLALALHTLLGSEGRTPSLQFGIPSRKLGAQFEAHAWVEADGVAFLRDGIELSYLPLIPAGAAGQTQLMKMEVFK